MEASKSGKYRVWLTYDFNFGINLQGLFQFLDKYDAKECGHSTATFMYRPSSLDNLLDDIKVEISTYMTFEAGARIYIVYPKDVEYSAKTGLPYYHVVGKLISGFRKPAQWAGYYQVEQDSEVDE
jgi:hypothetical protein